MAYFLFQKFKGIRERENSPGHVAHQTTNNNQQRLSAQNIELARYENLDGIEPGHHAQILSPIQTHDKLHRKDNSEDLNKAANIYRWKLILGLLLPFSVQALDLTIIAPAVYFIASDFNQLPHLNWILSAYNLCNAAFIPLWAQLADTFGRYTTLQAASLTTLLGAILCATAPIAAFPMLLIGRALQGAGCAGLLILTKIILADKVTLKETARNNTAFSYASGIAYGIGPVLGGYLTDANWRYCFVVNIPVGILGMILTHFLLRPLLVGPQEITRSDGSSTQPVPQTLKAKLATLDYIGQLLFLLGCGTLVLSLTWAGSTYRWSSPQVLVPLLTSVVLLVLFTTYEYYLTAPRTLSTYLPITKPMIPLSLLASRNSILLLYLNFCTGMAMYAIFYFSTLYLILVHSLPASSAGRSILYYLPGLAGGAYAANHACNVWPLRTWFPLATGALIEPIGITLVAVAMGTQNLSWLYGMIALAGLGTGIRLMPGTLHGVGYYRKQISSIVSLMALSQTLGGTVATTFMLNIFNSYLTKRGVHFNSSGVVGDAVAAAGTATSVDGEHFRTTAQQGIILAFFALTAFLWLGLITMFGFGNVRIAKGDAEEDTLTKGSYVGSWFRSKNDSLERGDADEAGS